MRLCNKCKLEFSGDIKNCPLCNHKLTGNASPAVFPIIENKLKKRKNIVIVTILLPIIFFIIEYLITRKIYFSLIVNSFILPFFVSFKHLSERIHIIKFIHSYFFILVIIFFILSVLFNYSFVITIILPILYLVILLFNFIVFFKKNKYHRNYILTTLFWNLSSNIIYLLLYIKKISTSTLIDTMSFISIIQLISIIIVSNKQIIIELKKTLNRR